MNDAKFEHPRLVAIYDALDSDRRDLDAYAAMVDEFAPKAVIDLGCGTGLLARRLARLGFAVTGVNPAAGSLDYARTRPGGLQVAWILGDAAALPTNASGLVLMTGNAAQAVVDQADWDNMLSHMITFRDTWMFEADGAVLASDSTLGFRDRAEVESDLRRHGYVVEEVRDAPDRSELEFVFVARRTAHRS